MKATGAVVPPIYQDHAQAQFPEHLLIKGLQAAVIVESNENGVELKIETHRFHPIPGTHGGFILTQCRAQVCEDAMVVLPGRQHCRGLQHAA